MPTEPEKPPDPPTRAELALVRRAVREQWGVPDALKTEVIAQVWSLLTDPDASDRKKLAAERLLVAMDRADLAGEKLELERSKAAKPEVYGAVSALLAEAVEMIDARDSDRDREPADPQGPPGVP